MSGVVSTGPIGFPNDVDEPNKKKSEQTSRCTKQKDDRELHPFPQVLWSCHRECLHTFKGLTGLY
jgi:hypothetical protein